ncbi:class I SAM-dependent methyltransferase [Desulfobacterales bacterium HSG16]|nr:class I SAM-dependent methyltransferase [Desulfobacterales bacterium HSG16]
MEIGFGTGNLIEEMAGHLQNGIIEGIDFSETMVDVAQRKNKKYIDKGKVKIRLGDFNDMPFDDDCFDKIYSVNTIYFWKNPKAGIARIHDILKPGGKLVLGFHDKEQMDKMSLNEDVFRYYSTRDVADLLSNDGLLNKVDIISRKGKQNALHCAVGIK